MSDKTKADSTAKKVTKGDMIDPKATSPSKDPNREERAGLSTATEPNSKQRVGQKVSRTGRNNGGDGSASGNDRLRTRLGVDPTADTLGEREAVSPAETDVIWTNESKDRWGGDQPEFSKLLAQRDKLAGVDAESEDSKK